MGEDGLQMRLAEEYVIRAQHCVQDIYRTQKEAIDRAADSIAASMLRGQVLHVFGSGHSQMIAREVFSRAGQLVPISMIVDRSEGKAERSEGYAERLLRYYQWEPREIVIVISNSGRNALPIEVAMKAKESGLEVVALTSVDHSSQVSSRHSSGKKLTDLADIVIDNRTPMGDAVIDLPGTQLHAGPMSTIAGAAAVNMIMLTVMQRYLEQGEIPPISISTNLDGADEHNQKLRRQFLHRIRFE